MNKKPAVLLIMDGYGIGGEVSHNAIHLAKTPELDALTARFPATSLSASGEDVGLPDGQIGNSEVGHTNIGAGRVVYQDLPKISSVIRDGSFFENPAYKTAMQQAAASGAALHLLGLLSDGGVHSHNTHLYALIEMAKRQGVGEIYVHAFLDGRDVAPRSGAGYMRELVSEMATIGAGSVATVMGRFWAMDRDKRWDRVERAYAVMVYGEAESLNPDPVAAIEASYAADVSDEFVAPVICNPKGLIKSGDSVIFFNFRPDRAREITYALTQEAFDGFERRSPLSLHYVCTKQYDESLTLPIAFPPEDISVTFGEYLSRLGKTQLRIAETEKYAHVTFFFNGGVEQVFDGEDRALIPSPREFPTYDLIPEMSARAVTDEAVTRIKSGAYDAVIMNLANCDMVGHTGIMPAAIEAVEVVDECVGRVFRAVEEMGGVLIVTADHGNADKMAEADDPHTAHTTNPVPFIVTRPGLRLMDGGRLCDIAPTFLELMDLPVPAEMTGHSLIIK